MKNTIPLNKQTKMKSIRNKQIGKKKNSKEHFKLSKLDLSSYQQYIFHTVSKYYSTLDNNPNDIIGEPCLITEEEFNLEKKLEEKLVFEEKLNSFIKNRRKPYCDILDKYNIKYSKTDTIEKLKIIIIENREKKNIKL
jgi:hypothetical protein